jgi:hypothetical protein
MPKFLKWLLIFIGVIFLLIASTYVVLTLYGNQLVKNSIVKTYNQNPKNPYNIDFESVELRIRSGDLHIHNISVTLKDSLVTLARMGSSNMPNSNVITHIEQLSVNGFDVYEALQKRKLTAESFEFIKPDITVYEYSDSQSDTTKKQDTIDIRNMFLTYFDTFLLSKVAIIEARTRYYTVSAAQDTQKIFGLENLSYSMYDVVANKTTLYSEDIISFSHYGLESTDMSLNLPKAKFKIGAVSYQSQNNSISITNASYMPSYTANQLFRRTKYRKPWIAFEFGHLEIAGFNLKESIEQGHVKMESLKVKQPNLRVNVDLGKEFPPNVVKPMLSEQIKQIPYPVTIDTLQVFNGKVTAQLRGAKTKKDGVLQFSPMNVTAYNVTNNPRTLAVNPICRMEVTTQINNTGHIVATIDMDMESAEGLTEFNFTGTDIVLTEFNKVVSPIMRVKIATGEMKKLTVTSTLSNTTCYGIMNAHYENMFVEFENKHTDRKPSVFLHMATGLANGVLKNNNIPGKKNYHTGRFEFEKENADSFFKLLWLVNLYGLEDSILGSNKKAQRDKRKAQREADKASGKKKGWFNFSK